MSMNPWLAVTLFGLAVFGFAWMTPRFREPEGGSDPAYDRLLEELETENRELIEAIAKFKDEQDNTIKNLVSQIKELEQQVKTVAEKSASAAAAPASVNPAAVSGAGSIPAEAIASPAVSAAPTAPAALLSQGSPVPAEDGGASLREPRKEPSPAAPPAEPPRYAPLSISERYAELLAMHGKGKSVEQIAKAAGMNKGEVQLILQLAKREAEQLAQT